MNDGKRAGERGPLEVLLEEGRDLVQAPVQPAELPGVTRAIDRALPDAVDRIDGVDDVEEARSSRIALDTEAAAPPALSLHELPAGAAAIGPLAPSRRSSAIVNRSPPRSFVTVRNGAAGSRQWAG